MLKDSKLELENKQIQKIGDDLLYKKLTELFASNSLTLIQHKTDSDQEIGIDFFYEIVDRRTNKVILLFSNQNKSTSAKVAPISRPNDPHHGKISYQLETRHGVYFYYEVDVPILFTRTDITCDKVYWHLIQMDSEVERSLQYALENNKNTFQLYLDPTNQIDAENFDNIWQELLDCRLFQNYKKISAIEEDTELYFSKADYDGMGVIDQVLKTIREFDGLEVLPTNVISRSFPFCKDKIARISDTALVTDNSDLVDFFENIERKEGILRTKGSDSKTLTDSKLEGLEKVLDFFQTNLIYHLEVPSKKSVPIHTLFSKNKCTCVRCSFNRLDLKRVKLLSETITPDMSLVDKSKFAYTFYFMGDIVKSFQFYKEILDSKPKPDNYHHLIAKYNLMRLKSYLNSFYMPSNPIEAYEYVDKLSFKFDNLLATKKQHLLDSMNWIRHHRFIYYENIEIDVIHSEVDRLFRLDKNGGAFRNSHFHKAEILFFRVSFFIEQNLLLFEDFQDYSVFLKKFLDIQLAFMNIKHKASTKSKGLGNFLIRHILFFLPSKDLKVSLRKYDIKAIRFSEPELTIDFLNELMTNLASAKIPLMELRTKYPLLDRIKRILEHLTTILPLVEVNKEELDDLVSSYLDLVETYSNVVEVKLFDMSAIFKRDDLVNPDILKKALTMWSKDDRFQQKTFSVIFGKLFSRDEQKNDEFLKEVWISREVDLEEDIFLNYRKYEHLLHNAAVRLFIKNNITKKAQKRLKTKFDPKYYYNLAIRDIIPLDMELLKEFQGTIPDLSGPSKFDTDFLFMENRKNESLSEFINLMYYYDLPFEEGHRSLSALAKNSEYYIWLMDLEGFDYSRFDPSWVMAYRTKPYFDQFKKCPILLHNIRQAVKEEFSEGLARIYFLRLLD